MKVYRQIAGSLLLLTTVAAMVSAPVLAQDQPASGTYHPAGMVQKWNESADVYLSDAEQARLKAWLATRRQRQAERQYYSGGKADYRLTSTEMCNLTYLPNAVMEALDLPLGYRDGSRLGFFGSNAVLIIPSSGQLIDVLPDAIGDTQALAASRTGF